MNGHFRKTERGVIVNVKVIPKASNNEVLGVVNDELRVKLTAPPVKGAANEKLIELLAKFISSKGNLSYNKKVKKRDIKIIKGETSKKKQVEIRGIDYI